VHRRHYLAALAGGSAGLLAGCNGVLGDPTDSDATGTATRAGTTRRPPADPIDVPVPKAELSRGAARDAIPAIVDPAYGPDWGDVAYDLPNDDGSEDRYDPSLAYEDDVLGVVRDGRARAYPLKLLDWHEVVNDDLGGPLLATYCPVCRSGVVADRHVAGETRTFGVSGFLYRANLVLYDRESDSLWSQLHATAIRGPLAGTELSLHPATVTSWGQWTAEHPDGDVLLPPPESGTVLGEVRYNYDVDIYGRMRQVAERFPDYGPLAGEDWRDTRLRRRTIVLGVTAGGAARAYSLSAVQHDGPINDVVGGRPVLVALGRDDTLFAYDRRVDGEVLSFRDGDGWSLRAGGSTWQTRSGEALDGPHEGRELAPATDHSQLYWAAWLRFNPDTTVYGID
jgi:hypothetical protein